MSRHGMLALGALLAFQLATGCCSRPVPTLPDDELELPELADSRLVLPVRISGSRVLSELENSAPDGKTRLGAWVQIGRGEYPKGIKYKWTRSGFAIAPSPDRVVVKSKLTYRYRMAQRERVPGSDRYWWREAGMPSGSGSPAFSISLDTRLDSNWKPRVESRIRGLPSRVEKYVGLGGIKSSAEKALTSELSKLTDFWERVALPRDIPSVPGAHFLLNPSAFEYAPFHTDGRDIVTHAMIVARPEIIVGDVDDREPPALPPPVRRPISDGLLSVYLDAQVTYSSMNELLQRLVGKEYGDGLAKVTVRSIEISGRSDVLLVKMNLRGPLFAGDVYLKGGAIYDRLTKDVWVPAKSEDSKKGLSFHARSRLPRWIVNSILLEDVRAKLAWNLSGEIDRQIEDLHSAFGEATGGKLALKNPGVNPTALYATDHALKMYVEVSAPVVERR